MANSNICAFKPGPERNSYKQSQNIQKPQQQQQQQSTNSFHVLIDNTGFSL